VQVDGSIGGVLRAQDYRNILQLRKQVRPSHCKSKASSGGNVFNCEILVASLFSKRHHLSLFHT
jgi:hypothetical protein